MLKRSLIVFIFNTKAHIMPTNLQLARRATCYRQVRSQFFMNLIFVVFVEFTLIYFRKLNAPNWSRNTRPIANGAI